MSNQDETKLKASRSGRSAACCSIADAFRIFNRHVDVLMAKRPTTYIRATDNYVYIDIDGYRIAYTGSRLELGDCPRNKSDVLIKVNLNKETLATWVSYYAQKF